MSLVPSSFYFYLYRVLILPSLISGDQDFVCNHMGTEASIGNMTWAGLTGLGAHPITQTWYMQGDLGNQTDLKNKDQAVGTYQGRDNLTYVLIYGGSHMVSVDKGPQTLDMLERYVDRPAHIEEEKWLTDQSSSLPPSPFPRY